MNQATVIGHFDWRGNNMIGAVAKARNIYEQLGKEFNKNNIACADIYEWRKHRFSTVLGIIKAFVQSKNIVLVISDTGSTLMSLFSFLKSLFHRRILYCVVGGDIAERLIEKKEDVKKLKPIDMFFVETSDCLEQMHNIGLSNTVLLRNFKCIEPVELSDEPRYDHAPFCFCTFSRVIEQKGITDAVRAIEEINNEAGGELCRLDIYGSIDCSYIEELTQLLQASKYCLYKGVIDQAKAVETLQQYYCLLFPTKYQTEGIPGTIIDGFAAGLPVICSDWKRSRQLVSDGKNGLVYPFGDLEGLKKTILFSIENTDAIEKMRKESLKSFQEFKPDNAIKVLVESML